METKKTYEESHILTYKYISYEDGVIRERIPPGKWHCEKSCENCNRWYTKNQYQSSDPSCLYRLNYCKDCIKNNYVKVKHFRYEIFRAAVLEKLKRQMQTSKYKITIHRYDIPDDLLELEVKRINVIVTSNKSKYKNPNNSIWQPKKQLRLLKP